MPVSNAELYGIDVQALDDLPDPEVLCAGDLNVAYALARRLAQDADAMEEIGLTGEYDAINIEDSLGDDFDLNDSTYVDNLQQQITQVLTKDPRVLSLSVQVSLATGAINVNVQAQGADGPFSFVLPITAAGVQAPFLSIQP